MKGGPGARGGPQVPPAGIFAAKMKGGPGVRWFRREDNVEMQEVSVALRHRPGDHREIRIVRQVITCAIFGRPGCFQVARRCVAVAPLVGLNAVSVEARFHQQVRQSACGPTRAIDRDSVIGNEERNCDPEPAAGPQHPIHVAGRGMRAVDMLPDLIGHDQVEFQDLATLIPEWAGAGVMLGKMEAR